MTATDVAASMTGCAGQRCMAAAAMVGVGEVDHIIKRLCEEARKIIPGKNLGAIISKKAKERIEGYITEAENESEKIYTGQLEFNKDNLSWYSVDQELNETINTCIAEKKYSKLLSYFSIMRYEPSRLL